MCQTCHMPSHTSRAARPPCSPDGGCQAQRVAEEHVASTHLDQNRWQIAQVSEQRGRRRVGNVITDVGACERLG